MHSYKVYTLYKVYSLTIQYTPIEKNHRMRAVRVKFIKVVCMIGLECRAAADQCSRPVTQFSSSLVVAPYGLDPVFFTDRQCSVSVQVCC